MSDQQIHTFMDGRGHIRRVTQFREQYGDPTLVIFGVPVEEADEEDRDHLDDQVINRPTRIRFNTTLSSRGAVDRWYQERGLDPKTGRPLQ